MIPSNANFKFDNESFDHFMSSSTATIIKNSENDALKKRIDEADAEKKDDESHPYRKKTRIARSRSFHFHRDKFWKNGSGSRAGTGGRLSGRVKYDLVDHCETLFNESNGEKTPQKIVDILVKTMPFKLRSETLMTAWERMKRQKYIAAVLSKIDQKEINKRINKKWLDRAIAAGESCTLSKKNRPPKYRHDIKEFPVPITRNSIRPMRLWYSNSVVDRARAFRELVFKNSQYPLQQIFMSHGDDVVKDVRRKWWFWPSRDMAHDSDYLSIMETELIKYLEQVVYLGPVDFVVNGPIMFHTGGKHEDAKYYDMLGMSRPLSYSQIAYILSTVSEKPDADLDEMQQLTNDNNLEKIAAVKETLDDDERQDVEDLGQVTVTQIMRLLIRLGISKETGHIIDPGMFRSPLNIKNVIYYKNQFLRKFTVSTRTNTAILAFDETTINVHQRAPKVWKYKGAKAPTVKQSKRMPSGLYNMFFVAGLLPGKDAGNPEAAENPVPFIFYKIYSPHGKKMVLQLDTKFSLPLTYSEWVKHRSAAAAILKNEFNFSLPDEENPTKKRLQQYEDLREKVRSIVLSRRLRTTTINFQNGMQVYGGAPKVGTVMDPHQLMEAVRDAVFMFWFSVGVSRDELETLNASIVKGINPTDEKRIFQQIKKEYHKNLISNFDMSPSVSGQKGQGRGAPTLLDMCLLGVVGLIGFNAVGTESSLRKNHPPDKPITVFSSGTTLNKVMGTNGTTLDFLVGSGGWIAPSRLDAIGISSFFRASGKFVGLDKRKTEISQQTSMCLMDALGLAKSNGYMNDDTEVSLLMDAAPSHLIPTGTNIGLMERGKVYENPQRIVGDIHFIFRQFFPKISPVIVPKLMPHYNPCERFNALLKSFLIQYIPEDDAYDEKQLILAIYSWTKRLDKEMFYNAFRASSINLSLDTLPMTEGTNINSTRNELLEERTDEEKHIDPTIACNDPDLFVLPKKPQDNVIACLTPDGTLAKHFVPQNFTMSNINKKTAPYWQVHGKHDTLFSDLKAIEIPINKDMEKPTGSIDISVKTSFGGEIILPYYGYGDSSIHENVFNQRRAKYDELIHFIKETHSSNQELSLGENLFWIVFFALFRMDRKSAGDQYTFYDDKDVPYTRTAFNLIKKGGLTALAVAFTHQVKNDLKIHFCCKLSSNRVGSLGSILPLSNFLVEGDFIDSGIQLEDGVRIPAEAGKWNVFKIVGKHQQSNRQINAVSSNDDHDDDEHPRRRKKKRKVSDSRKKKPTNNHPMRTRNTSTTTPTRMENANTEQSRDEDNKDSTSQNVIIKTEETSEDEKGDTNVQDNSTQIEDGHTSNSQIKQENDSVDGDLTTSLTEATSNEEKLDTNEDNSIGQHDGVDEDNNVSISRNVIIKTEETSDDEKGDTNVQDNSTQIEDGHTSNSQIKQENDSVDEDLTTSLTEATSNEEEKLDTNEEDNEEDGPSTSIARRTQTLVDNQEKEEEELRTKDTQNTENSTVVNPRRSKRRLKPVDYRNTDAGENDNDTGFNTDDQTDDDTDEDTLDQQTPGNSISLINQRQSEEEEEEVATVTETKENSSHSNAQNESGYLYNTGTGNKPHFTYQKKRKQMEADSSVKQTESKKKKENKQSQNIFF